MRSTKEFTRRVFAYIKQVNRDKELPSAAVRVGLVIADHWNEESGEARPSLQTIALESGLGEGTVRRMLPALVERGHLAVQVGSRGSGHPNRYWPLDESANGGAIKSANEGGIESANGGVSAKKPKAPFPGIKAPSETKKAPTGALNTVEHTEHSNSAPPARSSADDGRDSASDRTSVDEPLNPAFSTVDDALVPDPDGPVPRPVGRPETVEARQPPPASSIGTAATNASPGFDEVCRNARKLFGTKGDAVAARLLAAFDDDVEEALDHLAVAADEADPMSYLKQQVERTRLHAQNQTPWRTDHD
ncbi:helix-turn-helix domain-containing protein [Bradyrhizobium sp. CSS354]|uniref:helix-turn-helix domain-containing protein n=1 Tax=Bradyrhizobium sp. CSS354 TaxID=2699172 RepID=UPI0023B076C5|nr:helix-turn-helix domain-containing protein [Bradyrhizobium sp. CSS354]MDE5465228.1 hypothetical protein [Bradyrhizobium sp. CSS354]